MAFQRLQDSEAAIHAEWVTNSGKDQTLERLRRIDDLIDEAFPRS